MLSDIYAPKPKTPDDELLQCAVADLAKLGAPGARSSAQERTVLTQSRTDPIEPASPGTHPRRYEPTTFLWCSGLGSQWHPPNTALRHPAGRSTATSVRPASYR